MFRSFIVNPETCMDLLDQLAVHITSVYLFFWNLESASFANPLTEITKPNLNYHTYKHYNLYH